VSSPQSPPCVDVESPACMGPAQPLPLSCYVKLLHWAIVDFFSLIRGMSFPFLSLTPDGSYVPRPPPSCPSVNVVLKKTGFLPSHSPPSMPFFSTLLLVCQVRFGLGPSFKKTPSADPLLSRRHAPSTSPPLLRIVPTFPSDFFSLFRSPLDAANMVFFQLWYSLFPPQLHADILSWENLYYFHSESGFSPHNI